MNWFIAHLIERDADALHEELCADVQRRTERGLPPFEPSYELAYNTARNAYNREAR